MDSAEQAALSESEHDGPGQPQSLTKRHYEAQGLSMLVGDHVEHHSDGHGTRKHQRDVSAVQAKPMRRFDKQSVNLSSSSILLPSGVDVNGKQKKIILYRNDPLCLLLYKKIQTPKFSRQSPGHHISIHSSPTTWNVTLPFRGNTLDLPVDFCDDIQVLRGRKTEPRNRVQYMISGRTTGLCRQRRRPRIL